jgi:TetR/AcrR family transcriptional repressor of nem operon
MPRPRGYVERDVVEAAKDAFWENGYGGTGIADLERSTGLNRSSLYLAFGSKRALLKQAIDAYTEDLPDPLLAPMELGPPGLEAIVAFFSGVRGIVADQHRGRRGCLVVNTIAELCSRDDETDLWAAEFLDRLRRAFTRALKGAAARGEIDETSVARRARMLSSITFGIWLSARIDAQDAAALCDEITSEVRAWSSS